MTVHAAPPMVLCPAAGQLLWAQAPVTKGKVTLLTNLSESAMPLIGAIQGGEGQGSFLWVGGAASGASWREGTLGTVRSGVQRAQPRACHSLQAQQTVKRIRTAPHFQAGPPQPGQHQPRSPGPRARPRPDSEPLPGVCLGSCTHSHTRPPGEGLGVCILQRGENIPPAHSHPELCLPWSCRGRRREARGAQGTVGRKGGRKRDAVMGAQRPRETQRPHTAGAQ